MVSLGACAPCAAQVAAVVAGKVVDTTGAPIADVEVMVLESGRGVRTSPQGTFRLTLTPTMANTLRFRRIGYLARVIHIDAGKPQVDLLPIILQEVPEGLPEISVEGKLPTPTLYLRPATSITRKLHGAMYYTWDTHGAAMSPNALASLRYLGPGARSLASYAWFESLSHSNDSYTIHSGGCPSRSDVPLTTAWAGWSDTLMMLTTGGEVWEQRRGHGLTNGLCRLRQRLSTRGPILNAGPMLGGWLVLARDSSGAPMLTLYTDAGPIAWRVPPPPFLRSDEDFRHAHFVATQSGATISSAGWPFEWVEVNASGSFRTTSRGLAARLDSAGHAAWSALPALALTNGYVQTLISAGARARRIVLYDLLGRLHSITQVVGAPGLVAVDLTRRKLLGLRYSSAGRGRSEVVEYDF